MSAAMSASVGLVAAAILAVALATVNFFFLRYTPIHTFQTEISHKIKALPYPHRSEATSATCVITPIHTGLSPQIRSRCAEPMIRL